MRMQNSDPIRRIASEKALRILQKALQSTLSYAFVRWHQQTGETGISLNAKDVVSNTTTDIEVCTNQQLGS